MGGGAEYKAGLQSEAWWRQVWSALHSEDSWSRDHPFQSEVEDVKASDWLLCFL